jgi:hypothetical protein
MKRDAEFSSCGSYRYSLSRVWDESLPAVLFIMLNPSSADGTKDDPSIRRCISYAKDWGFGSLFVGNLFALKSTKPAGLLDSKDPTGAENQKSLLKMTRQCKLIICAWGNGPTLKKLSAYSPEYLVQKNLNNKLYCLTLSLDGIPCHPLYLPKHLEPIAWKADS